MSADQGVRSTYNVHTACIRGVEAWPVTVEVSMGGGIPGISIVGMAENSVLEARVRIRCALKSCGFDLPRRSIIVNLAPGDVRKTGTGFDLPIAVAILALSGQINLDGLDDKLFIGELGLDGDVLPCRGEVAYGMLARDVGLELVTARPETHIPLEGVRHRYLDGLGSLARGVDGALASMSPANERYDGIGTPLDFSDVVGQDMAKRAMAVAACGGLGMMMVGPPGSGKTMLARRMTSILPPMDCEEQQEALRIHSVLGEDCSGVLSGHRPFRNPHHSVSCAGLVGGGRPVRPGEISLAHGGVLFLDELAEFPSSVLQTLRQPIEEGSVRIVRVEGSYVFPSAFQLLAATNPCPCGNLGDPAVACTCSAAAVQRYQSKLGGPLADRIDIVVDVARPDPDLIVAGCEGVGTADLASQVERGRRFSEWRSSRDLRTSMNEDALTVDGLVGKFGLDCEGQACLLDIARRMHLTGRGIMRLCKVARTIADIDESSLVRRDHVLEASLYRGRCGEHV